MQSQNQAQLVTLIKGQMFEGVLLVRAAEQRTSSNGSKFLDLSLCDISMEINAKMWDGNTPAPKAGSVVRVRALMTEFAGKPQLRVDKLRETTPSDAVDMSRLIPCAPYPAQEMLDLIQERVEAIADPQLKALVQDQLERAGEALLTHPAAQKIHHAERAGLLHHTSTMLRAARAVCEIYPQLDADLLAAGVVLHDLCKIDEIDADGMGLAADYTREGLLVGHLVSGVARVAEAGRRLGVRQELLLLIQHMILSHHDLPEYGSPRRPMFPEAEALHILDLLDARMFEMEHALAAAAPGGFTERIWSLERRLYRRTDKK